MLLNPKLFSLSIQKKKLSDLPNNFLFPLTAQLSKVWSYWNKVNWGFAFVVYLNQKSIDIYLFLNEDRLILGQVAECIERTLQMLEVRTPHRWKGGDNQKNGRQPELLRIFP